MLSLELSHLFFSYLLNIKFMQKVSIAHIKNDTLNGLALIKNPPTNAMEINTNEKIHRAINK